MLNNCGSLDTPRASTIERIFLQNDHHFRGRGQYLLHILYNLLKSSLPDFLLNSLPLSEQPYANTLWKRCMDTPCIIM